MVNNEQMTPRMAPVLERAADGDAGLNERPGASEDVSFFLNEVPGLYFNLGIVPRDQDLPKAATMPSSAKCARKALITWVRWRISRSRVR